MCHKLVNRQGDLGGTWKEDLHVSWPGGKEQHMMFKELKEVMGLEVTKRSRASAVKAMEALLKELDLLSCNRKPLVSSKQGNDMIYFWECSLIALWKMI